MQSEFGRQKSVDIESLSLIKSQIEECDFVYPVHRNKIFEFCKTFEITDISQAGYKERKQYENYLNSFDIKRANSYLYAFDRTVIYHKKKTTFAIAGEPAFSYRGDKRIYLVYEIRKDKMDMLFAMRGGEYFAWDFAKKYPDVYKRQITEVLNYIVESTVEECDLRQKRRLLITLKYLYDFLPAQGIYNLMEIDAAYENRFEIYISETYKCLRVCAKVAINLCRKVSFLRSRETNWYANVWYMDRFNIDEARVNESDRIRKLSFMGIESKNNRRALQEYIKYLIGLTDMSLSTIRAVKYHLEEFVIHIGNKHVHDVTASDIDSYIEDEYSYGNRKEFIDRKLTEIYKWYQNLQSYGHIKRLPFHLNYYVNTKYVNKHNDRSVEKDIINLILENLKYCDEKLRLMFLVQLCSGRRISEVCQVKAKSLKKDDEVYWICFYQPKMHEDIMVPIPENLYKLLKAYIKQNEIESTDYIFQSENGKAYNSGQYQKKMSKFTEDTGICRTGYNFKSHDFRHTIATQMYNYGASIQVIRDFLGHKTDEMTKQYIDFIPKEIERKSRLLFEEKAGKDDGQVIYRHT